MRLPVFQSAEPNDGSDPELLLNVPLVAQFLIEFLKHECVLKRKITTAVIGLSGGVDSAVVAYLCAEAFGPSNVMAVRMPYKVSSPDSLTYAQLVSDATGIRSETIEITQMVDGYLSAFEPEANPTRIGNVCARCRMTVLFDQSAKIGALPIGTGNKTERLMGYYTWHGDDAPPINPLGDLFKTQVWELARHLGVPEEIVAKPPTADLVRGQTDEADLGVKYQTADRILARLTRGWTPERLADSGFDSKDVQTVNSRLNATHWKRHLPTVALVSESSINDYYLRPVDYTGMA